MASRDSRTQRLTANLAFHTFAACLGGFSAGLNLGNLNTPGALISQCNKIPADKLPVPNDARSYLPCWEQEGNETAMKSIWGTVCSLLAVGGFVGALMSTPLATKLGRRYAIMTINLLFMLGGLLMAMSNGPVLFGFGRFFSGVATGAATSIVSMYVNEISTEKIRGALGACLQLNVVIGIMVASLIGKPLSEPEVNQNSGLGWRIIVFVVIIPAILQVLSMLFCVETPRYLISKGLLVEAKAALQKLRGHQWNVDYEYADILKSQGYGNDAVEVPSMKSDLEMKSQPKDSVNGQSGPTESTQLSFAQVLKHQKMRKMLFVAIGIHLCQQITGINSIITYSTEIFRKAYPNTADTLSIVVMLANLLATFPSLVLVEKLGRKSLLFYGLIGMTAGTTMVFLSMTLKIDVLVIIGVLTYIVFFAVGLGPIPFLIIPELFPTKGVAVAAGLANFVNYLSNFLVVLTFPMYETPLGDYVFVPFLVLSALGAFFVFACVPETKGRSLAQLGYAEDD